MVLDFRMYFIFRCAPSVDCKSTEIDENNFATCDESNHSCCAKKDIKQTMKTSPFRISIPTSIATNQTTISTTTTTISTTKNTTVNPIEELLFSGTDGKL